VLSTGHNWGSEHDPGSHECSPSTKSGGKFLMYMYSVSGIEANNKVWYFSVCSVDRNSRVVLVVALVERWTRDRKVTGSTPGRGAIKSTRSTQPSIPPG